MFFNSLVNKTPILVIATLLSVALFFLLVPLAIFASTSDGTIDPAYHYAWGENVGWIDFGATNGNVHVTDTGLSGYVCGENIGWISLESVSNTPSGVLSGYAWGENVGWIDFAPAGGGVSIDTDGVFVGSAYGENIGWIIFSTTTPNKVSTDWRHESVRNPAVPPGATHSHSEGGYIFLNNIITQPVTNVVQAVTSVPNFISNIGQSVGAAVSNIIPDFLKPLKSTEPVQSATSTISEEAPLAMSAKWDLLPIKTIGSFVFAPLPSQIKSLAAKFPELNKLFQKVGVEKMSDVSKLNGVALNIPGLSSVTQKMLANTGAGKIALTGGLPTTKFTADEIKNVPSEFIFARTEGEKIDLGVTMKVDEKGAVSQSVDTLPGKTMTLVVKPLSAAKSVTGYFTYRTPDTSVAKAQNLAPRSAFTASAIFAMAGLVEKAPTPAPEQKLVLSSFEYTDPDHDGIYTAHVVAPVVAGNYDVITIIDYVDPALGMRQMRLTTVVDPEGYVFEKNGDKDTRIPKAVVSIYSLNRMGNYEIWPAKDYQQTNPQTTGVSGTYSFLAPPGSYYIGVTAPGYKPYKGDVFVVAEGSGVHQNIEMVPTWSWLSVFDWKTIITIITFLLLIFVIIRSYKRT